MVIILELVSLEDITVAAVVILVRGDVAAVFLLDLFLAFLLSCCFEFYR